MGGGEGGRLRAGTGAWRAVWIGRAATGAMRARMQPHQRLAHLAGKLVLLVRPDVLGCDHKLELGVFVIKVFPGRYILGLALRGQGRDVLR
jgi:hypothetical protein